MTLYFLVNTFTTTGYGDIYPITTFEILFISIVAILSKVYVGVALTDVLSGLQYYIDKTYHLSADMVLVSREADRLDLLLTLLIPVLQKLYRSYGVPHFLTNRVRSYFTNAWQQNGGIITPDLLHQAPEVHRLDICYDAYGHVLQNVSSLQEIHGFWYWYQLTLN